jgi:hypothetical protein
MAVSKVELANGEVLMDLTGDSVTPDTLAEGETAHDATGEPIVGRMKSGGGVSVQSDWNQTDETAADFIKNKPFGDVAAVLFEGDITFDAGESAIVVTAVPPVGSYVTVNWDGVEYTCQVSDFNGASYIGNGAVVGLEATDEPFAFMFVSTDMVFAVCLDEKGSVSAKLSGSSVNKLDSKYVGAATVFYINPDDGTDVYLYADIGLTTKVTAGELKTAIKSTAVTLSESDIYFYAVNYVIIAGSYGVAYYQRAYEMGGQFKDEIKTFYTAEYTT